jgi:hypothetical protein
MAELTVTDPDLAESRQLLIDGGVSVVLIYVRSLPVDAPIVRQFRPLLKLLIALCGGLDFAHNVLEAATELSGTLATTDTDVYNPLDIHTFSLATITLSEFIANCEVHPWVLVARKSLKELKPVIEKKAAAFHGNHPFDSFYAPEGYQGNDYKVSHWTDCLLQLIDQVEGRPSMPPADLGLGTYCVPDTELVYRNGWLKVLYPYRRV